MTLNFVVNWFSSCTFLYGWLCISFEWVFVMYKFVWKTLHYLVYGMSSCIFLYEWLCMSFWINFLMYICLYVWLSMIFLRSFLHAHFCKNAYHFMMEGFSSWTFLYEWLPFLFDWFSSCTFLYECLPFPFEWIIVMHISVRMTFISFWMDCRHSHFCRNDYHFFLNGLS